MAETLKGTLELKHSGGSAWAEIEIPSEALSLPREQIMARYIEPALANVLQMIRERLK